MRTIQTPIPTFTRPSKETIEALKDIGTATVAGSLGHAGFRNPHMLGPVTQNPGKSIVGVAQTLQFLPQRIELEAQAHAGRHEFLELLTDDRCVRHHVPQQLRGNAVQVLVLQADRCE